MELTKILPGPTPASAHVRIIDFPRNTGLDDRWAIMIEDLLTPKECERLRSLVEPTDGEAWPAATVTAYDGSQLQLEESRRCGRIFFTSPEIADALLLRMIPFLPAEIVTLFNAPDITGQYPVIRNETWRISKLREELRFLRYEAGDYFRPHCDGQFVEGQKKSFLTVHMYVSGEGLEGGETSFLPDRSSPEDECVKVNPKVGSVLIFQQRDLYHQGCEVKNGVKYTMRTDVVYEKL